MLIESNDEGRRPRQARFAQFAQALAIGLLVSDLALAQEPAPKAPTAQEEPATKKAPPAVPRVPQTKAEPAAGSDDVEALSLHYRFTEHYAPTPDPNHPELITQYRVGARETTKVSRENPGGAPIRAESVRQTIYTERVAKASRGGDLTDAIRRYDKFFYKDYTDPKAGYHPPKGAFQGLTLWVNERPGLSPLVIKLAPERPLQEFEYDTIVTLVSPSRLKGLFPPTPVRIGDTWRIPLPATIVILPELPDAEGYSIEGTLVEVHKAQQDRAHEAVMEIQGQFTTIDGPSAVNARMTFLFTSPVAKPSAEATEKAAPRPRTNPGLVDARGQITDLRMARVLTSLIPETDGRLQQTTNYELHLAREPTAGGGDPATLLPLPEDTPKPDETNSWILYDDPAGRFHFKHPQDLKLNTRSPDVDVEIRNIQGNHVDVFGLQLQPTEANTERERLFRDPEYHRRNLLSNWKKQGQDVVKGPIGWLPEADWAPYKRKVYRIEAALRPQGAAPNTQRVYGDCYLAVFPSNKSFFVTTMTMQDPHVPFRDQVESVIKSFDFGPSRPTPAPAK